MAFSTIMVILSSPAVAWLIKVHERLKSLVLSEYFYYDKNIQIRPSVAIKCDFKKDSALPLV